MGNDVVLPLAGVRIIDLTDGAVGVAGRYLADLGADVILVEPPEGAGSRRAQPIHGGQGLRFATAHYNKRGVVLDLNTEAGRAALLRLVEGADLVLESHPVGGLDELGVGPRAMRERNPGVVVVSITPFGQSGPYRDWQATEAVLLAMSATLARSGGQGREPLVPPGELATETAAVQAAFAALLALYRAVRTGRGEYVDCSLFDLVVQGLDPAWGMAGTATMGRPVNAPAQGQPDAGALYPVVACADGHVRTFIASPKHWRSFFTWLGEPEEFADPAYEQMATRAMNWGKIKPTVEAFFANQTRDEIVARGGELGIAFAALSTAGDVLRSEHVEHRGSFVAAEVAPGLVGTVANGFVEIDDRRAGFRFRAPTLGEHTAVVLAEPASRSTTLPSDGNARPLAGIRVLDLGVIVVGAESGRLLADQGADVIKVESRVFGDGARQYDSSEACSLPFSVGNRNKRSMGLNLRSETGRALFGRLVAESDVVLTNFKPGTLESLGLGYEALSAINPRVVLVESSALGSTGPWSRRMGYGPLVRATVGLTALWRHPGAPDGSGDVTTVYPDHAAARVAMVAVMAALIQRERTGRGIKIGIAQMETVFSQLATDFLRESLEPGTMFAKGNVGEFDAPWGLYRCEGQDAYCAITVTGDDEWLSLARVIGRPDLAANPEYSSSAGRVANRAVLDAALREWLAAVTPRDAQERLQAAGIAAGAAVQAHDLLEDPQLSGRNQFGRLRQPGHDHPVPVETGPALFENIGAPEVRPAPLMCADTRAICRDVLQMTDTDVDDLLADGVLESREPIT